MLLFYIVMLHILLALIDHSHNSFIFFHFELSLVKQSHSVLILEDFDIHIHLLDDLGLQLFLPLKSSDFFFFFSTPSQALLDSGNDLFPP